MLIRIVKSFGARIAENTLVIAMVLVCFAALQLLLGLVFPAGTSLRELMRHSSVAESRAGPGGDATDRGLFVDRSGEDVALGVVADMHRKVMAKTKASISWHSAQRGMALRNRDAIQTMKRASALIEFDDEQEVDIGENTLIILRGTEEHLLDDRRRSRLTMVGGELHGKLAPRNGKSAQLVVETPTGIARFQPDGGKEGEAEFRVKVDPDGQATVIVDKGSANISSNGEEMQLGADEFTTITTSDGLGIRRGLAAAPRIESPAPGELFRYREVDPRIEFGWTKSFAADQYRLTLAKDEKFREVIYDRTLSSTEAAHQGLEPGSYHWRVVGVRNSFEVTRRAHGRFVVERDTAGPRLDVSFPDGVIHSDTYLLKGSTDPGSRLMIDGVAVPTNDRGEFEQTIRLEPGLNVVVVESFDRIGNVTYRSEMITSKY